MKKGFTLIFGYGLLSLIFLSLIYLIVVSEGTMNIKWSEFTRIDINILYAFTFIYIMSFAIFLFYKPNYEKKDLKKLNMKKSKSAEEYEKLLLSENKYLFLRTSTIGSHTQRHYISDKEGNVYYKILLTDIKPDVFTVYDVFDNELGQLKTSILDAFKIKNTFIINNKEIFKYEKGIKELKVEYKIEYLNWNIEEKYNEFIINFKSSNIGIIEKFDFCDYDIVVEDKNKKLELSILAVCILLSDDDYRRIKN